LDIQKKNLIKSAIKLAILTCTTVANTINSGKAAANELITSGIRSTLNNVVQEKLTGDRQEEVLAALGLDDATLSKPRVVKIKAVSDAARATYPVLANVQKTLKMRLEAVRGMVIAENGGDESKDPGYVGATLRKNIMVRTEIAAALDTLGALGTKTAEAKTDADTNLPLAQAVVDELTADLAALTAALEELKAQQRQEEEEARLTANEAAVTPPVPQRIPTVSVTPVDGETEADYQYRRALAIRDAAIAKWNDETPPLNSSISDCQAQIEAAQSEINAAVSTSITVPRVADFISAYGGGDALDANTTASYKDSVSSYAAIEQRITDVTPVGPALPGIITKVEALTDLYNTLFNLQNQVLSLVDLLADCNASGGENQYYPAWVTIPGMGQAPAEDLAVVLTQHLNLLPLALANARSLSDKLAAATDAWSSGIGSVRTDLDENLVAAETALTALIAQGAAWENALAASPGLVLDPLDPLITETYRRLGYFSENPDDFTLVLGHAFDMATYKASLLAALLVTPGSEGLATARGLRAKYDALVAANPAIKDAYDAAWQSYQSAFAGVQAYAGEEGAPGFPVYDDWTQAAAYTSTAHPVDASAVTNQAARYHALYNTSNWSLYTSLTGGALIGGENNAEILSWMGLPNMHQLPDPGLDDPASYLPHRIAAMKAVIIEDGPTWLPLAEDAFNAQFNDTMAALWIMDSEAFQADDGSQAVVEALRGELAPLQSAYYAAHPAPTIVDQPASSVIPAGTTAQLFVTATSDLLTYQWSMSADSGGMYSDIVGATSSTLTTPVLSATRWFRVVIRNPGGTVGSDPARIEVSGGSSDFGFTSAASASAQVGVPFNWTFTTSSAGMISVNPQTTTLPPGLTFMPGTTGTLEGTPTAAGAWEIFRSRPASRACRALQGLQASLFNRPFISPSRRRIQTQSPSRMPSWPSRWSRV
jgi:hypothetical protein